MADNAVVPEWLGQQALISPGRIALVCGATTWTFAELSRRADAAAAALRQAGLRAGDHVALLATNSADYVQTVFGISRMGAVLVLLNARLTPEDIAWQIEDCEAACLVSGLPGMAEKLRLRPGLKVVDLNEVANARAVAIEPAGAVLQIDLSSLHGIIYTSGTAGRPKGAMLTYGNHLWSAFGSVLNLGLRGDDRWLACMPLFHVGGLAILLRGAIYGMTVVVHESFDPERLNHAIDEHGITIVSLVSTMARRMLEARGDKPYPPSLRCVLVGGGPVPDDLVGECLRRGIPIAPTYGLTEASSQVTTLRPEETSLKPGSAGKPLMPVDLRIERDDGSACAAGEGGEIVVRGPTVTAGYFRREDETARALRGGWLHTGDFGHLDGEGYLYVLDRRDDVIISGGENVYPAEVEKVLESHPAVNEAGVFAVPDRLWGQAVGAAVSLHPGANIDEAGLREFCRGRLAAYKVPRLIRFAAELPRNASGKLLRRELREKPP